MQTLLDDGSLERSAVVANCRMNRERCLAGSNGYDRELGLHPLVFLTERLARQDRAYWLDLCCGRGRALIEAGRALNARGLDSRIEIVGVDLVGMFDGIDPAVNGVRLVAASLSAWRPQRPVDLITCVHGLHYIGDKLGLIARAASWLVSDGFFAANFDLASVKLGGQPTAEPSLALDFRRNGLAYGRRKRLLTCRGTKCVSFAYRYLGADDRAGPNYTGQPAVESYYEANN